MVTAMGWVRKYGIEDATGTLHKINAYASIEPRNWDELLKACYMFGSVAIGVALPRSASEQFDNQVPWTTGGSSAIVGGHCITACGRNSAGYLVALTWGRTTAISRSFIERYMEEGVVAMSLEYIRDTGLSPENFNEAQLESDINSINNSRGVV
jgi:hypothetical protein